MALLYPWATKEYLLWEMSIGQIVMYHNIGIELKYPKSKSDAPKTLRDQGYEAAAAAREELQQMRELTGKGKQAYRDKYGDV